MSVVGYAFQRPFWQGGNPHGPMFVGEGQKTFARVGCVVCCVAMALRHLGVRAGATPLDVNRVGKTCHAFAKDSSSAVVRKLIDCQSGVFSKYDYPSSTDIVTKENLRNIIDRSLVDGGVVMAHVDYNDDDRGDHWVLIFRSENGQYVADDPAIASHVYLDHDTLSGECYWKDKRKNYEVLRLIPIVRSC